MRVFVAGATGAIGRQLVPRLVEAGHEVHGMTRSESKQAMLYELGAGPVVADAQWCRRCTTRLSYSLLVSLAPILQAFYAIHQPPSRDVLGSG